MFIKIINFGYQKLPERKHYNDTGADVYLLHDLVIQPFETIKVPVGFGIELPDGYNAHFQTRTSIAIKGIFVQQCAIDAGYRGELHLIVTNLSNNSIKFNKGDRLAYLEVYPIVYADFVKELGEERKDGAFGSTNENTSKQNEIKYVKVSTKILSSLYNDSIKLEALEDIGVSNWDNYNRAINTINDEDWYNDKDILDIYEEVK